MNFGPHLEVADMACITVATDVEKIYHECYELTVRILVYCFSLKSPNSFVVNFCKLRRVDRQVYLIYLRRRYLLTAICGNYY